MAGGTIDIWPLYLYHPGAITVNFAIDRYAGCVVETRSDSKIVLRSLDLELRPPFPKGYTLEQGDWSLLAPVKARPAMWRRAP